MEPLKLHVGSLSSAQKEDRKKMVAALRMNPEIQKLQRKLQFSDGVLEKNTYQLLTCCLLYTSPSPRD